MDSIKKSALGTEIEIKHAEVAIRFLKETNTLLKWYEYTKNRRFNTYKNEKGVVEWWKLDSSGPYCTSIFGNHNFGDFLYDCRYKFRPDNFTTCFAIFIYMNYDDDVIIKYKLLGPSYSLEIKSLRDSIDKYYEIKKKLAYSDLPKKISFNRNTYLDSLNALIERGCLDKWHSNYKRKKVEDED
jgi:hypothetical protein